MIFPPWILYLGECHFFRCTVTSWLLPEFWTTSPIKSCWTCKVLPGEHLPKFHILTKTWRPRFPVTKFCPHRIRQVLKQGMFILLCKARLRTLWVSSIRVRFVDSRVYWLKASVQLNGWAKNGEGRCCKRRKGSPNHSDQSSHQHHSLSHYAVFFMLQFSLIGDLFLGFDLVNQRRLHMWEMQLMALSVQAGKPQPPELSQTVRLTGMTFHFPFLFVDGKRGWKLRLWFVICRWSSSWFGYVVSYWTRKVRRNSLERPIFHLASGGSEWYGNTNRMQGKIISSREVRLSSSNSSRSKNVDHD